MTRNEDAFDTAEHATVLALTRLIRRGSILNERRWRRVESGMEVAVGVIERECGLGRQRDDGNRGVRWWSNG